MSGCDVKEMQKLFRVKRALTLPQRESARGKCLVTSFELLKDLFAKQLEIWRINGLFYDLLKLFGGWAFFSDHVFYKTYSQSEVSKVVGDSA